MLPILPSAKSSLHCLNFFCCRRRMSDTYSFRDNHNGKYAGELGGGGPWDHSTPVARRPEYRAAEYELTENGTKDTLLDSQRVRTQYN